MRDMQAKGMIFDLDGVLVDTAKFHYLAWKRLADELFQIGFTERDNEQFKGVNRVACMEILCKMAGETLPKSEFDRGMSLKNNWYVDMVRQMTAEDVLPGAREYVEKQKASGVRCAIGSASKNCALVLKQTGLESLFDAIADGTIVVRAKPDPEVFLTAARMLGLAPADCIVFEDAQAGIDAAKAGGMRCCAIGKPQDLAGYDWICDGLECLDEAVNLRDAIKLCPSRKSGQRKRVKNE